MLVAPITIFRSFIAGEAALAEEKRCYKCQMGEKNEQQVDTGSKNIGKERREEGRKEASESTPKWF